MVETLASRQTKGFGGVRLAESGQETGQREPRPPPGDGESTTAAAAPLPGFRPHGPSLARVLSEATGPRPHVSVSTVIPNGFTPPARSLPTQGPVPLWLRSPESYSGPSRCSDWARGSAGAGNHPCLTTSAALDQPAISAAQISGDRCRSSPSRSKRPVVLAIGPNTLATALNLD